MSTVWPVLHYDDTEAALRFLVDVVGFTKSAVVRDEVDDVVHAELAWPGGGTVLFGGTKHVGGAHSGLKAGALYLVTDDVDAVHARLAAASAEIVAAPHETSFAAGGPTYACSARDTGGEPAHVRDVSRRLRPRTGRPPLP